MRTISEGRYYIQLANSTALEASASGFKSNGARIGIWNLYFGLNQLWEVRNATAGGVYLINVGAMKALDAHSADVSRNGCRVQLWDQHGGTNQRWLVEAFGGDSCSIRCAGSAGNKVLDVKNGSTSPGGELQLWDLLGYPNQMWKFVPAADRAVVTATGVDLRQNQTPIKSQGGRGACSYFGTTGALEAAYKKAGYGDVNLSEEFWSIMGKALYIHPIWGDISHANYRENQFGGTQGGGSVQWYKFGFKLPTEADVPYRNEDYWPPNWDSRNQREASDFNVALLTPRMLQPRLTYGAKTVTKIPDDRLTVASEYERVLDLGFEISIATGTPEPRTAYDGHNMLLVGYDKSDANHPAFLVKNSWGPAGGDPRDHCIRIPYSQLLDRISSAESIADVTVPAPWPELSFLGRWNLTFDGHQGMLDIYHLPGVGNLGFDVPTAIDRRIGVFYDAAGAAFRVNGILSGNKAEFYFDGSRPNLGWGELSGRRFVYFLSSDGQTMSGFHHDVDGSVCGGYASKSARLTHGTPARNDFSSLAGATWNLSIGEDRGTVLFGRAIGTSVKGTFRLSTGKRKVVEANLLESGLVTVWVRDTGTIGKAKFLNHEAGLLCGSTVDGKVLLASLR